MLPLFSNPFSLYPNLMFDTHCHLNYETFDKTLSSVIKNARESGIKNIVIPGTDLLSSKKALEIAEDYDGFYFAAGVHPTERLDDLDLSNISYKLEEILKSSLKAVAVGEAGLDYYKPESSSRLQKEFLKMHISLARKLGLSLIIHTRHSTSDILSELETNWSHVLSGKTVFHCATPDLDLLNFAITKNIYLGFDGDITYDSNKQEFAKKVSIDQIVIETDSPFLTPEPIKSEVRFPNEPKNLHFIAQKIAELKELSLEEVITKTSQNGKRLFNI